MNGLEEQFFTEIVELEFQLQIYEEYKTHPHRDNFKWTTKDGEKLTLRYITDSHLNNIIKCIEQKRIICNKNVFNLLKLEYSFRKNYHKIKQELSEYNRITDMVF